MKKILFLLLLSANCLAQINSSGVLLKKYPFPLDMFQNAQHGYSLRRLSLRYNGALIRVRRSSDNSEQNIGFTTFGDLDTAALKTFVGAGTAYITTMYDQGRYAIGAIQTTAINQPKIMINGVVTRRNGVPVPTYSGSQKLDITGDSAYQDASVFACAYDNSVSLGTIANFSASGEDHFLIEYLSNPFLYFQRHVASTYASAQVTPTENITNLNICGITYSNTSGGTAYINKNKGNLVTVTVSIGGTSTTGCIGAATGGVNYLTGGIAEVIIFRSALNSSYARTLITSINSYYHCF